MILRRIGNKARIAAKIIAHFPKHVNYVEPFFGAGGMFFNKPLAKYNFVNDMDSDVFNLFMVFLNRREELLALFEKMPIHQDLLRHWKKNKEEEPLRKALRFLFLSNFTYLGNADTLHFRQNNEKSMLLQYESKTFEMLKSVRFANLDFEKFLKSLVWAKDAEEAGLQPSQTLIYADPPYLQTGSNYENKGQWNEAELVRLLDAMTATKANFALSEFAHHFVLQQAKERGLNVIEIGERQSLKNRSVEILVTNYDKPAATLF